MDAPAAAATAFPETAPRESNVLSSSRESCASTPRYVCSPWIPDSALPRNTWFANGSTTSTSVRRSQEALQLSPSIVDLLTALPLLLSLDRKHYTATLNCAQDSIRGPTAFRPPFSRRSHSSRVAEHNADAATTAVKAVLSTRGSSSWQMRRRRFRQIALDAFFQSSLTSRITLRRQQGPPGGDGIVAATERLLAHTRAVMADVSPTQTYLVDLFSQQLLRHRPSSGKTARWAPPPAAMDGALPDVRASSSEETQSSPQASATVHPEYAQSAFELRSIMKSHSSFAAAPVVPPPPSRDQADTVEEDATIAEKLLYIVLRTSIAANTPRRTSTSEDGAIVSARDGDEFEEGSSPLRQFAPDASEPATTSSLTHSPAWSAGDTLVRKRPRLDPTSLCVDRWGADIDKAAITSCNFFMSDDNDDQQSIRNYPCRAQSLMSSCEAPSLPYEPRCWLAPSTVALVESCVLLRRHQRWTCDLDPIIEATIAGERLQGSIGTVPRAHGSSLRRVPLAKQHYASHHAMAILEVLNGDRSSWASLPGTEECGDAAALESLLDESGLPFAAAHAGVMHTGKTPSRTAPSAACGTFCRNVSNFHWNPLPEEDDTTVAALFTDERPRDTNSNPNLPPLPLHNAGDHQGGSERDEDAKASRLLCRTPFVSCQPVYDELVYAQVHLALHRCTAGFCDPYGLTNCDDCVGVDLPAIRVSHDLYEATPPFTRACVSVGAVSGLTSLLEWGCHYGTLMRRLLHLCDVADGAALRGSLGSYGRSAIGTLRLLICLVQRQIGELGYHAGGPHRLSFSTLFTAQQRLRRAVEQIDVLAEFFGVPADAALATDRSATTQLPEKVLWEPVAVLQQRCTSALLLSRLYERFNARHANSLSIHGCAATHHRQTQEERMGELLETLAGDTGDALGDFGALPHAEARERQLRAVLSTFDPDVPSSRLESLPLTTEEDRRLWTQQRKELLSNSIDAIGMLLRATLRPLNTMLHRWLIAGELDDPYDEFFVVPSHGQTHSGYDVDLCPQRLPVFLSPLAAKDLLHAGVSLRVLRAAASHVVHSAKRDVRRLEGMAEVTEAAAEDYAAELVDTQTLQVAIEHFVERLVHGSFAGADGDGSLPQEETEGHTTDAADYDEREDALLPLSPCVDVLSPYGAIHWWRQHYQACTHVLLQAVEEAANADEAAADENEDEQAAADSAVDGDDSLYQPALPAQPLAAALKDEEASENEEDHAEYRGSTSSLTGGAPPHEGTGSASAATEGEACKKVDTTDCSTALLPSMSPAAAAAAVAHPSEAPAATLRKKEEDPPYITVFMNSDDDNEEEESEAARGGSNAQQSTQEVEWNGSPSSSVSSRPVGSSASTSVLGLHRIASSRFSTGTTASSNASSRGALALYGAITEELRQVALREEQREVRLGQSRHALRTEFDAQLLRQKRENRLSEWRSQRLALRLRRQRAMEGLVEELREVFHLRGVGNADPPSPVSQTAASPVTLMEDFNTEELPTADDTAATAEPPSSSPPLLYPRLVVPLRRLPPKRAAPPVVLYTAFEDLNTGDNAGGWRAASRAMTGRSRRTSFAANPTIVEIRSSGRARCSLSLSTMLLPSLLATRTTVAPSTAVPTLREHLAGAARRHTAANLLPPLIARWPKPSSAASPSGRSSRKGGSANGSVTFLEITSAEGHTCSSNDETALAAVQQLHDISPSVFSALDFVGGGNPRGPTCAGGGGSSADAFFLASLSGSGEGHKVAKPLREHLAPGASTEERQQPGKEEESVRRDELGYAHADALYTIADINDDAFLLMRTGPQSYARQELENAARASLASAAAELRACTVDDPAYLRRIMCAGAEQQENANAADSSTRRSDISPKLMKYRCCSKAPLKTAAAAAASMPLGHDGTNLSGGVGRGEAALRSAGARDTDAKMRPLLSAIWGEDAPLLGVAEASVVLADRRAKQGDFTDRLWAWTPAESHRWYFSPLAALHRALTGPDVDRVLLTESSLTHQETESLLRCSGYYRSLGQYTSSFLTHKALQLTLLPPYGSLHRLITQFLDVCLLQNAPIAVRLMDTWITSVDAALRMIAEEEEANMERAIVCRQRRPLLSVRAITDARNRWSFSKALTSLNAAFQREWAACVANGESTVMIEWSVQRRRGGGTHARVDSSAIEDEEVDAQWEARGAAVLEGSTLSASVPASHNIMHQNRRAGDATVGNTCTSPGAATSSPVQTFLTSLRLSAVSPWCSGAWLLPDDALPCTASIFRSLLFWKSAERIVLHTWRAGMESGLSTVFFFCTTVRQVLLSTFQETLWGKLCELAAEYRESLRFEAGVLYNYRSLESFTVDHANFLRECEFYTFCGEPFQQRVQPLLQAMVQEVEEAERSLRFAQVSVRVAQRQLMATLRSMVEENSSDESEDDNHHEEGGGAVSGHHDDVTLSPETAKVSTARSTAATASGSILTPSRWSRRTASTPESSTPQAKDGVARPSPWYMQPLEDALAKQAGLAAVPSTSDAATHRVESEEGSVHHSGVTSPPSPSSRTSKRRLFAAREGSPSTTFSNSVTPRSSSLAPDKLSHTHPLMVVAPTSELRRHEDPSPSFTPRMKSHRKASQPSLAGNVGGRLPSSTVTTPRHSGSTLYSLTQKRSRSTGLGTRRATKTPLSGAASTSSSVVASSSAVMPRKRRRRRKVAAQKRDDSAERRERHEKLRAIAKRKIQEETDHQRRLMRDMVARQLNRFLHLTKSLCDALAEIMAREDVSVAALHQDATDSLAAPPMVYLQEVKRRRLRRYQFLSAMLRRLNSFVEVMEAQS